MFHRDRLLHLMFVSFGMCIYAAATHDESGMRMFMGVFYILFSLLYCSKKEDTSCQK